jgi:hemerythrin
VRSLQWTVENSVYLPELDEEHRMIFRLLQELRHAVVEGAAAVHLELKAQHLAAEVNGHFRHEERLMREARYPQAEWHKRQHATNCEQMATLAKAIHTGEQASIFESLEAMAKGIRDHISVADRMAGAYLRNHRLLKRAAR